MGFFSNGTPAEPAPATDSSSPPKEKTKALLMEPAEGVEPKPQPERTPEQKKKLEELERYTQTLLLPEDDPYAPWEMRWLSDPLCYDRYGRAAKWDLQNMKDRIKATLEWRREYKPDLISPDDVGEEAKTGKIILTGFDNEARPVIYMRPGRENTKPSPRQIRHLVYILERARDLCPPGQEKVSIVVDYKSATASSNPSIGTARKVINLLQSHYIELLGRGLVVNLPFFLNFFFKGIQPFLDPVTRDKIRFNPNLKDLIPVEHLDAEFGGEYEYEFDYEIYWNTLKEKCGITSDGARTPEHAPQGATPTSEPVRTPDNDEEAMDAEEDEEFWEAPEAGSDVDDLPEGNLTNRPPWTPPISPAASVRGSRRPSVDHEHEELVGGMHKVDLSQMQAMRQNIKGKYAHTAANYERNTGRDINGEPVRTLSSENALPPSPPAEPKSPESPTPAPASTTNGHAEAAEAEPSTPPTPMPDAASSKTAPTPAQQEEQQPASLPSISRAVSDSNVPTTTATTARGPGSAASSGKSGKGTPNKPSRIFGSLRRAFKPDKDGKR